jgi:amphi-Trp domain-containing protein
MGKDNFGFARIASPEEIAEYLTSIAVGLKRGEVNLESGEQSLRLTPGSEVKLELRVRQKEESGKIGLEIAWRRTGSPKAITLQVHAGERPH